MQQDPYSMLAAYGSLMAKCFNAIEFPRKVEMRLGCFALITLISWTTELPALWIITPTCLTMAILLLQRIMAAEGEEVDFGDVATEEMTPWLDPECDMQSSLDELLVESEADCLARMLQGIDRGLFAQVEVQIGPQVAAAMVAILTM
jgi:hypothetical protein